MNTVAAEKRTAISIKNILYATDFSPAAIAALPYVRGIARQYGAEIHVLYVKQPASYAFVTPDMIPNMAELEERLAKEQSEEIHKVFSGIPHEMVCGTGSLWNEMDQMIHSQCIDLIVIGSSGRTGAAKMLLGSAAAEILRRAPCPVLTVGPHCAGSAKEHLNMREILYATDFSPESVAAAPYAISFAREHRSDLTLLNVIQQTRGVELVHADQYVDSAWRLLQKFVPAEAGLQQRANMHRDKRRAGRSDFENRGSTKTGSDRSRCEGREARDERGHTFFTRDGTRSDCQSAVPRAYGSRTEESRTTCAVEEGLAVCGNGWLRFLCRSSSPVRHA